MMSAIEARKSTNSNIDRDFKLELEIINNHVVQAVREGEFRVVIDRTLRSETIKELGRLGYGYVGYGDNQTIIDWSEWK